MAKTNKYQSWNPRSKKWVCFENGRICGMEAEKYSDIPVKKDKPGNTGESEPVEDDPTPAGSLIGSGNPFWLM